MHIMIDLETLDLKPTAMILQVGMVRFEKEPVGRVDVEDALNLFIRPDTQPGRTIDVDTVLWWMQQSEAARENIIRGHRQSRVSLATAMTRISNFVEATFNPLTDRIWAHGTDFDLAVLNDLFRTVSWAMPWPHNLVRDLRTFLEEYPLSEGRKGVAQVRAERLMEEDRLLKHDAVTDCVVQICRLQEAMRAPGESMESLGEVPTKK